MPAAAFALTGNAYLDGILSGVRWTDTVLTYGFPTANNQYGSDYPWNWNHDGNAATPPIVVNETTGFVALNAAQQDAARAAFAEIGRYVTVSFLEVQPANSADLRLAMSTSRQPGNTTAYNFYPGDGNGGDGWFNTTSYNTPLLGTYAYQTFFHEIGHGMGLKHGHQGDNGNNTVVPADRDSPEFTTMTYRSFVGSGTANYTMAEGHYPQTFMMLDILALQLMYGADFNTQAESTTYRFDPNNAQMFIGSFGQGVPRVNATTESDVLFRTIWDGNGTDTYDFSAYGADRQLDIDLAPGGWTDVDSDSNFQAAFLGTDAGGTNQWARGQVFNAYLFNNDTRSLIENAIGGAGNDRIRGNQTNNRLDGLDGDDVLEGFDGNDILDQGNGGGAMYGGNGLDNIVAGPGEEYIDGGNDFDYVNYARSTTGVWIDGTQGKITGSWADGDTLVSIEGVVGSNHGDTIRLGAGVNALYGGFGNDQLDGGADNDFLYGQDNDDVLVGGHGADRVDGGIGFDTAAFLDAVTINLSNNVHGGEAAGDAYLGIEVYQGSSAADLMIAGNATGARFHGGDGADQLYGGAQQDYFRGGKDNDTIHGGAGFDMASWADAPGPVIVELLLDDVGETVGKVSAGEWGGDTITSIEDLEGSAFGDGLYGSINGNKLVGLGGNDRIDGRGGQDILEGGAGDDAITISADDWAYGGEGIDTAYFGNQALVLNLASGFSTEGGVSFYLTQFEVLVGTVLGDQMYGSGFAEQLLGGDGFDTLWGGGAGDYIDGGTGNDWMAGQDGDDVLVVGAGADIMAGGAGFDTMLFARAMVADWQSGVLDADIGGDSWSDWESIQGSSGDDRIRTNSWGFSVDLRGGAGNDVLATGVTGVVADRLDGEAGDDALDGGAGDDVMLGGAGNDLLIAAAGNDLMNGGEDIDTATYAGLLGGNLRVDLNLLTAQDTGVAGFDTLIDIENVTGSGGADVLRGNAVANLLNGNGGADLLQGGDQNDTLIGGAGNDTLQGQNGADLMRPGDGADVIDGGGGLDSIDFGGGAAALVDLAVTGAQNTGGGLDTIGDIENVFGSAAGDTFLGNGVNNVLNGREGADRLEGRSGIDRLVGGAAADSFVYRALSDAPAGGFTERILDFEVGIDKLDFSAFDWNPGRSGLQPLAFVSGDFTAAGQVRFASGRLQLNADTDLADLEFVIAMSGVVGLGETDFWMPGSTPTVARATDPAMDLFQDGVAGSPRSIDREQGLALSGLGDGPGTGSLALVSSLDGPSAWFAPLVAHALQADAAWWV